MSDDARFRIEVPIGHRPAFDTARLASQLSEQFKGLDSVVQGIQNLVLGSDLGRIRASISEATRNWALEFADLNRYSVAKKSLKEQGILPHRSTPWGSFEVEAPDTFPAIVLGYYHDEWPEAEEIFLADIDQYRISDDAKDSFTDAVKCHRIGLYRSSVLTLLTAAEMEFRRAFGVTPGGPAAGLQELRESVLEAPASTILGHFAPLDLFSILNEHMYEPVKTPEAHRRFSSDPIPNRHAAIHGLIHYKTGLNSLNSLIMADYVFFLISQLSEHLGPAT